MKGLNILFCSIVAATLLGSGPCLAGEGSAAPSIAAQQAKPAAGNNPIPWNGNFFGVTLPAPEGRNAVCEHTVKNDAVTVRIDGMSWDEFVNYCKTLEKLSGWRIINEEGSARFPAGPRPKGTVYFTGAYGKLQRINVRYMGDGLAKQHNRPNFMMFVFETF